MTTVPQAFHDFLTRIELTEAEQVKARHQQADLRERLRSRLPGVVRDVLVGSYARKTAIRPLNDIDLFLVLDPREYSGWRSNGPTRLLETIQRALRECYSAPGPATRIQGRSVNIEFRSTGIGYDVIPAFPVQSHVPDRKEDIIYEIPDRSRRDWIRTNPESHRQRCIEANNRSKGMLNRLIKAAKYWNQGHRDGNGDKPLRSFHLEVMAYDALNSQPANERIGLRELFKSLESRVESKCPDPARLGPAVNADLSTEARQRARAALRDAAKIASEAILHEDFSDDAAACARWKTLLGPEFKY